MKPGLEGSSESASRRVAVLDQTLWKRMAEGETLEATLESWLAIQCGMIRAVTQGVLVLGQDDSDIPFAPVAIWPEGGAVSEALAGTAELVVSKGSGIIRRGKNDSHQAMSSIGYPLRIGSDLLGVVAIQLDDNLSPDLKQAMRHLQLGAGWFEALTRREKARQQAGREERERLALKLIGEALAEPDFEAACISVANELAAVLRCERVSLGFLHNKSAKVAALSHTVQLDAKLNLSNAIADAMDEALDQDAVLIAPVIDDDTTALVSRAQHILIADHNSGHVVTVPFKWRAHAAGAFTFEKARDSSFSDVETSLCKTVATQLGPLLEERRRENRWLGAKAAEQLFGGGSLLTRIVLSLLLLISLFLIFAKGDYRVAAPAYLKGEVQRVIAAPFDGYVAQADYRAGDVVRAGDVIAALDDRELMLERARWSTQRRQHLLEYDQALGAQKRSEVGVIRARIHQTESQIALIDAQLTRSTLSAPFDGVLVSGDLSQSIGGAVRKGDTLFEIIPSGQYRIVIELDEADIRYITEGQQGSLVLTSLPGADFPLSVTKIGPVSASNDGMNFFEVEATLLEHKGLVLRPGMEGIAKVNTGKKRYIWIWTHRFFDWMRLQIWSLWP